MLTDDPREAAAGADAVYTDVWVSMSDDPEAARRRARALAPYPARRRAARPRRADAIALHCLPAHPGEEITAEVLYGSRQRIWDQAENRRHAQKALLECCSSPSRGAEGYSSRPSSAPPRRGSDASTKSSGKSARPVKSRRAASAEADGLAYLVEQLSNRVFKPT